MVEIGKKDSSRIMNMASMYCCFVDPKGKELQCQKNEEDRHSIYVRHQLAKGLELKQLTGVIRYTFWDALAFILAFVAI